MLKRERQAYFPYRVNLYYSVLTTDLSQHTTSGGKCFISKNKVNIEIRKSHNHLICMQNALVAASQNVDCLINSKKFNSQHLVEVCEFSKINTLISKSSPGELKHQPNLAAIQML